MKRFLTLFILLTFLIMDSSQAQQWVQDYLAGKQGFGNTDSLVSHFHSEMQKEIGTQPPKLSFVPIEKTDSTSLQNFKNQPTIVMFWNTRCSGSKMQLSELSKLHKKFTKRGLNVIYLSSQAPSTLRDFKKANDISGLVGHIAKNELTKPYQLLATPSVYLIDQKGKVQDVWLVPKDLKTLEDKVTPYL